MNPVGWSATPPQTVEASGKSTAVPSKSEWVRRQKVVCGKESVNGAVVVSMQGNGRCGNPSREHHIHVALPIPR